MNLSLNIKDEKPVIAMLDDDEDFRELMSELFRLHEFNADLVTMEEPDELLLTIRTGKVDLVLLDMHMSKMSGYEVARKIRRAEADTNTRIPIIAITAAYDDVRESISAGLDKIMGKPLDIREFRETLRSINIDI